MPSKLFEIKQGIKEKAKPFLKWAGGKGQLLAEIEKRLPIEIRNGQINTYVEPFVGGGAVFFHIAQNYTRIRRFFLFDINEDLVNCYKAVKENVVPLIAELRSLQNEFSRLTTANQKDFYIETRKQFNHDKLSGFGINTAAKLIFLNKTCYNGLYRVNSKNEFNVPFGGYENPRICDPGNLLAASAVLQKAEIICGDFETSSKYIKKKTFVYCDPPYRPLSPTASFTGYSKDSFFEQDQIRLAKFCGNVHAKGARLLLSNSDPKNEDPKDTFFQSHYPQEVGFWIDTVRANRAINCKATRRGKINELLVVNYGSRDSVAKKKL